MGADSEHLERLIQERHDRLSSNIGELERKLEDALDWRVQVHQRPATMLGLAFGSGLLLSAILGGPSRTTRRKPSSKAGSTPAYPSAVARPDFQAGPDAEHQEKAGSPAWDNLKGAPVGVVLTKCEDFLEQLLPGFTDQYHKAEARNRSNESGASSARIN